MTLEPVARQTLETGSISLVTYGRPTGAFVYRRQVEDSGDALPWHRWEAGRKAAYTVGNSVSRETIYAPEMTCGELLPSDVRPTWDNARVETHDGPEPPDGPLCVACFGTGA